MDRLREWLNEQCDVRNLTWREASLGARLATWGERFGGERKYAAFRKRLVDSGLALEQGRELALTRKGLALFSQVTDRGSEATPLLEKWPLLRPPNDGETQ